MVRNSFGLVPRPDCIASRVGLFNLGCYFWLHKFRHAFPISGWEALPGRGLLSLLHNGTCEAKNTNLNLKAPPWRWWNILNLSQWEVFDILIAHPVHLMGNCDCSTLPRFQSTMEEAEDMSSPTQVPSSSTSSSGRQCSSFKAMVPLDSIFFGGDLESQDAIQNQVE